MDRASKDIPDRKDTSLTGRKEAIEKNGLERRELGKGKRKVVEESGLERRELGKGRKEAVEESGLERRELGGEGGKLLRRVAWKEESWVR